MKTPETKLLPITTDTPVHSPWPGNNAPDYLRANEQRIFLGNIATGRASRPEMQDVYAYVETDPVTDRTRTKLHRVYDEAGGDTRERLVNTVLRSTPLYSEFVLGWSLKDISADGHETEDEYLEPDWQAVKLAIEKGLIDEVDIAPKYIPEWWDVDTVVMERVRRLRRGEPLLPLKPKKPI